MQMDLHVFYLDSIEVWILSSYCIFIVFSIVSILSSIPYIYIHLKLPYSLKVWEDSCEVMPPISAADQAKL